MNIDITRGLKEIDNSLYIVEGEAENNGEAIVEAYKNVNPSVEAVTLKETKHFSTCGSAGTVSGAGWNLLLTELTVRLEKKDKRKNSCLC